MAPGAPYEWMRFLDVTSGDDAVVELLRWSYALEQVYDDLVRQSLGLNDAPGGDLYEVLSVARATLSEGIELLNATVREFRAGEHEVA